MRKLVVLSSHYPRESSVPRDGANKPEIRHSNIYRALDGVYMVCLTKVMEIGRLKDLGIHNNNLIDYLSNCYSSFDSEEKTDFEDYKQTGIVPYNFTRNQHKFLLKHLPYWKQSGIWAKDTVTPIFEETWNTAFGCAENCYAAGRMLDKDGSGINLIYCLNMYPGHHAGLNEYGGYCFLNNAAVCAKSLQEKEFGNVVILDLDYHAGDGTYDIFKDDDTVTTVSIHMQPNMDYPFYSSYECEEPEPRNKNITFGPGINKDSYIKLLENAFKFINQSEYSALIIAFGGDTYKDDPDVFYECRTSLDVDDYEHIGQYISKSAENKPIVVTQEGGYNVENIAKIVKSFLSGLEKI